jgi:hypothetical protein
MKNLAENNIVRIELTMRLLPDMAKSVYGANLILFHQGSSGMVRVKIRIYLT